MKKVLCYLAMSLAATGTSQAFPVTVDIGTFAIDDYLGNGSGGFLNLNNMIASGQNFWWGANANVNGYWATGAGPSSLTPTINLDTRDKDVTWGAINDPTVARGSREFSDFIYYGGHGIDGALYLGSKAGYGLVLPAKLNLGVGYNRWFIANSCSLFNGGDPATTWQAAFKGLREDKAVGDVRLEDA